MKTKKAAEILQKYWGFQIKYTTSRAPETYGWNVCTLYTWGTDDIKPQKAARCKGGGYDMAGTCLGEWIEKTFPDELKKLSSDPGSRSTWNTRGTFYGLNFYDPARRAYRKYWRPGYILHVDGACGFSCMEKILNRLGIRLAKVRPYSFKFEPAKKGR